MFTLVNIAIYKIQVGYGRYLLFKNVNRLSGNGSPVLKCNGNVLRYRSDNRKDIPALPFCQTKKNCENSITQTPEANLKLGEPIRAKRLDNNLFQMDIAKIIGVSEESIIGSQKTIESDVKSYPKITEFLGYCPVHYARMLGDLFLHYRIHRGLSNRQLAKKSAVDPGIISRWKSGDSKPY